MSEPLPHAVVNPGDAVMLERPDGKWDVFTIDAAGESEPCCANLENADLAYEFARTVAMGGLVWLCCHSNPDRLEPYRVH